VIPVQVIDFAYVIAAVLFIIGLKMLSSAQTARRGNLLSAIGMLIAIIATLLLADMDYRWILVGLIIGGIIGGLIARLVKMTQMPEMVGLFNGCGGLASLVVGWAEYHTRFSDVLSNGSAETFSAFTSIAIILAVIIGGVTFTGSLIAWGKLAEKLPGKPILFAGQQIVNILILVAILAFAITFVIMPGSTYWALILVVVLSMILGVMSVIPIGGADMPVVISLLNSYSGLAASAAGFAIDNILLIVAGALVGASGIILTNIMCRSMNRSLANVLFSGFGAAQASGGGSYSGEARTVSPDDTYLMLEAANSVIFVPGYGMAVAQAQHAVRELGDLLEENGTEVKYVVHPVAGRMPGHMNVLLAEANVPYEQLVEPQDVNPVMETVDVALVIGANDVVNPAARSDESSPIYGMPIIDVDRARTVIILKRSMRPGFAGIDNPLFFMQNTRMLLGDAKDSVGNIVGEFKS